MLWIYRLQTRNYLYWIISAYNRVSFFSHIFISLIFMWLFCWKNISRLFVIHTNIFFFLFFFFLNCIGLIVEMSSFNLAYYLCLLFANQIFFSLIFVVDNWWDFHQSYRLFSINAFSGDILSGFGFEISWIFLLLLLLLNFNVFFLHIVQQVR